MAEASSDFESLLKRAREGDEAALTEIARRYEPELRLVAHVRLGPKLRPYVDTIDLVQSVHKSLLRGLRGGRFEIHHPDQLVALALSMVQHKVARQWRRHKQHQRAIPEAPHPRVLAQRLARFCASTDPGAKAEFDDILEYVCNQLVDSERQLIELRLQGYSTAEAARALGENPDMLRVQLSRLRRRLRSKGLLAEWL